jgi:hypothetical protein
MQGVERWNAVDERGSNSIPKPLSLASYFRGLHPFLTTELRAMTILHTDATLYLDVIVLQVR